jgi:hypothetical protein
MDVVWRDKDPENPDVAAIENTRFDFGDIDYRPFRKEIEDRILKMRAADLEKANDQELPPEPNKE